MHSFHITIKFILLWKIYEWYACLTNTKSENWDEKQKWIWNRHKTANSKIGSETISMQQNRPVHIARVFAKSYCVYFFFEQKKITLNKSKIDRDQKFRHMAKPTKQKKTIAHCEQMKSREETKGARERETENIILRIHDHIQRVQFDILWDCHTKKRRGKSIRNKLNECSKKKWFRHWLHCFVHC